VRAVLRTAGAPVLGDGPNARQADAPTARQVEAPTARQAVAGIAAAGETSVVETSVVETSVAGTLPRGIFVAVRAPRQEARHRCRGRPLRILGRVAAQVEMVVAIGRLWEACRRLAKGPIDQAAVTSRIGRRLVTLLQIGRTEATSRRIGPVETA
jgi:hypothetical protein